MTPAFVPARSLGPLLGAMLDGRRTFAVQAGEGGGRLARCRPEEFSPASCRSAGPLKPIFFEPRHDLGGYFGGGSGEERGPSAVLGARACDLAALKVLDWVFLQGDFADPGYGARREAHRVENDDHHDHAGVGDAGGADAGE